MRQDNRDRRLTYEVAKKLCEQNGLDVKNANPAYSYLRLETPIVNGNTQYQFPVLQNQTYNGYNQSPTEQRLALQDNFVVGSKGFFITFWNTTTNKPMSNLLTYIGMYNCPAGYAEGNKTPIWSGSAVTLVKGGNNEFWNSAYMRYSFDYKVIIPRWDMSQHRYVPRTQASFNGQEFDPATQYAFPFTLDQAEGLSDGFVPMEPNIVLSGAKNTEINYYLPFGLEFTDDLGWENALIASGVIVPKLVVIYRGVLLQNTTNVK